MRSCVAILLAFCCSFCTDTPLRRFDDVYDRIAVNGNFCTIEPKQSPHPVRIIFAVDSSNSMVMNDPNNVHVDAIESTVKRFAEYENVSFGIIRWGEDIVRELVEGTGREPDLFTRDQTKLKAAFDRMRQLPVDNPKRYLGGTNYLLALKAINDYIMQDQSQNPDIAEIAQYYVEFMTDGMPQSDGAAADQTRDSILAHVKNLVGNYPSLRFDVISIVQIAIVPAEFINLLPEMAQFGNGLFIQMSHPSALDAKLTQILSDDLILIEYELASITLSSNPRSLLVGNRNVRFDEVDGVVDVYVDSDADGIVDAKEECCTHTNPQHPDTDGDGLDDLFESRLLGEFDPLASYSPALSEQQLFDKDRDGLNFFIENRLGTDPERADTDGDGSPDGLEYREGTDPMTEDMRADSDHDGVSNGYELRQHTNPEIDEGEKRLEYSYVPEPVTQPYQVFDGRRCYNYRIANILLMETQPSLTEDNVPLPLGFNRLEIWRLERPVDDYRAGMSSVLRAHAIRGRNWIIFSPSTQRRDPPAVEITIRGSHVHE